MSILSKNTTRKKIETPEFSFDFREFDLPNGLHCILSKDNRNPIVNVMIGYQVGSKDEDKGKKGLAHLFEHMMFQGSENVKKGEHFEFVSRAGGTCNAFTMNDATVYYDVMPSNNFETALWLESDRLNNIDITEENLSNQKRVVIEEKKQSYDNAPYGTMFHNIMRNVFKGSNYESSVIGEAEDINSFTVEEAKSFHKKFYSPANSLIIASGDIDYDDAEEKIIKYFSDINKNGKVDRKRNKVIEIPEDIEMTVPDNIQLPALNLCWQIPKAGSFESYCLEFFLEMIVNNRSSRLHRNLVYEKKLLKSIRGIKHDLEDAGILIFRAMINPGVDTEVIKNEILKEINDFADKGFGENEFEMARNQIESENYFKFLKLQSVTVETVFNYLYYRDINRIYDEIERYLSVEMHNVTDTVRNYITSKKKLTLVYLPKS